jgi:long-chain acyl-CoA synthetase
MNEIIAALAERAPDDVVIAAPGQSVTAGQLLKQIEELSSAPVFSGIDRLGLLAENSPAWVIADLACQAAGVCLLPLPTFFAAGQLRHSITTVGIDAILTDDPARVTELVGADALTDDAAMLCGLTLLRFKRVTQPELPAGTSKITFTSGSTGTPRGVCLGAEQQIAVARSLDQALQLKAPRHLCLLPLSTLLENIGGVYYPLLTGGTVLTPNEAVTGFSGSTGLDMLTMLQAIDRHRPTSIITLPQMLVGLVAALEEGWQPPPELQFVAVGGAKVAASLIVRARQFGLPVYEGYGLSETGSVACLNSPDSELIGSVGKPLAHVDVIVEAGEVVIAGNSFLGYVDDPASWGTHKVVTGDLGKVDDNGYLHLRGRSKNMLISSLGRNISPEWIESEVLVHHKIAQCVVLGDARPYCVALIAAKDRQTSDIDIQMHIDSINADLPDYARIQRWYRLARPLSHAYGLYTENGRPRRAAIASTFATVIDSLYAERPVTAEPQRAVLQ